MKSSARKRILSIFLAVLMAVSGVIPATSAFAGDGVEGYYDLEIFYGDTGTIVPTYGDDGESEFNVYMVEGEEKQFIYNLIDSEMPDNGYIKWYSENPVLVDTDQTGLVKAFDSSKGAVIQSWIDNEVKTIPLIGGLLAKAIEKALFNEYVDLDSMDTEEIVDLVIAAFGSDSIIADKVEAYKGELVDSLRRYLDNINSNIHCQLFSADGTLLDDDVIHITVTKNEEWYSAFLPNGTHITNKSQINTTQAVGNTVQLYAITTPQRLGFGTVYSVKSTSVFDSGKVVATVDDSGLVTFKNPGTVTIVVSPDSEQVIEALLKFINYFYKLENTGTIDTQKVADILIKYVGIDMNRTVLAAILDVCFAIKDIAGDVADPVQLTASAVEILANIILQMTYNDTITFNVEKAVPITDFKIDGMTTVKEGNQIKMNIVDVQPSTGNTGDITWKSSDPTIACVDEKTGVITGLDAGGSLGQLSNQTCVITATSAANNIQKSVTITVTGKTGKYLSGVFINGADNLMPEQTEDYTYTVYPKRVAESNNLYITWGIRDGVDENGNPKYIWANDEEPATDNIGTITSAGHYTPTNGGACTIAVKAVTGYYLSNGTFYEISSCIGTKKVNNGIPVQQINVTCTGATSNGKLNRNETVNVNGKDYQYITIHKEVIEGYAGNGAVFNAEIVPANASNKNVTWVTDNSDYSVEVSDETHTCTVKQNAGHEVADTFNVYAVSQDGEVVSNVITVCVTRNYVTGNVINQDSIEVINGKNADATHTVSFKGSWTGTAYACYKANWYSSDESVFSVKAKSNDNCDAILTGNDVGTATLYCVSTDGGIVDSCQVTVKPNKEYLKNIVDLCENTVVLRTSENKKLYQQYMKKLDLAYYVLYDEDMASQDTCDTYADELLTAFYKLGGFVGIGRVKILGKNGTALKKDYVTVDVSSTTSYKKYSYDFDLQVAPKNAMYKEIKWTSSNSSVSVDTNGICRPTSNDPCSAQITCTVVDYMDNESSDTVNIAFARTKATGVTLDTTQIAGGKVGETKTISAKVSPTNVLGNSTASCTDVVWTSSDESVATVDKNGVVTFVYGGDCEIICTTVDGGYTASCAVNVVTNYDPLQLLINQYNDLQLNSVNYYPDTWKAFTDEMTASQAMIDRGGYSQKEVDAQYAKLENAYKSLKKYNYIQKVELYLDGEPTAEFYQYDLSLLKEGVSYKNAKLDLNVRLYPNNGSYASVKWESSTSDISVTDSGECSPTIQSSCYGRITCTVTDHFGSKFSDDVWVSFAYYPVTELKLSDTTINGKVGDNHQLLCTVYPTGRPLTHLGAASIQDFYWESDDENVATVDENGLVTFVNAGSTVIRAVSYDGGVSAECQVSTEGDRTGLKAAIDKYKDIDCTLYDYDYAEEFKRAYQAAENALADLTLTQDEINDATVGLNYAGEQMLNHPYILVDSIDLSYTTYKRSLTNKSTAVKSGTVSTTTDALSVNLSSGYSNYNNYNDVEINASPSPSNSMYKSISWNTDSSKNAKVSVNGSKVTVTPDDGHNNGAWAILTVSTTDHYDRVTSRTIYVCMSDNTCTGIDITQSKLMLIAGASAQQLQYTVSGSPEFSNIVWTSSDESVVRVDQNGAVTAVDKGQAYVTAKTVDGGYSDRISIEVQTDFTALAEKVSEYSDLINGVTDNFVYTEESLAVLSAAVTESKNMVDEGKATQAEVNAQYDTLVAAYNALEKYIMATGLDITVEAGQTAVTEPNNGYIRFIGTLLNGKKIQLLSGAQPEGARYKSIEWTSSNENITVDEYGLVTSNTSQAKWALITCKITNARNEVFEDSVYVSFVKNAVTGVTFEGDTVFGAPQEVKALSPDLGTGSILASAQVTDCEYKSSDESIATVDSSGNVTFVSQGTATITCTSYDGGFTGTITAYTTWDTTALQEALSIADSITYTDYAYEQGMAFKNAYEAAQAVYANVYATQEEIDTACANLQTATTNLEGNEFIKPQAAITVAGNEIGSGASYPIDENSQVTVDYALNEGAMVKSVEWSTTDENGVTSQISGDSLVLTKTAQGSATVTVNLAVTDNYDRVTNYSYDITIVNQIINITEITLTLNGEAAGDTYSSTGHKFGYSDYKPVQLGYIASPEDATEPASVEWKSSASTYITVDNTGLVELTALGKAKSSNTAVITCTVTNMDGTTVSKSINVKITR